MKSNSLREQQMSWDTRCIPGVIALLTLFFMVSASLAGEKKIGSPRPSTINGTPQATLLNINNISLWAGDDGTMERKPDLSAGVEFPRGTTTAVYAGGLVWGGIVHDGSSPQVRVGGQTYVSGMVPGAILRPGVVEDPGNTDVRIYRIRRDWATADLTEDAAEYFGVTTFDVTSDQITQLRNQYRKDWQEWPWQKGAPYYERNGIPGYQPLTSDVYDSTADEPGCASADQVMWFVTNDLTASATQRFSGSNPIGLEMQVTCWAYANRPNFNNVIFERYRLIYKGKATTPANAHIDSMYIAKWVDPDIGEFSDDLVGCSVDQGLGFAYNGSPTDAQYSKYNLVPPVIGYDIVQGPRVVSPGSTAHWNLQSINGYANLPVTSFEYFTAATRTSDFIFGSISATQEWWNVLHGYNPTPISPPQCLLDFQTNLCTHFELSGDPQTFRGWVDGHKDTPGDRRFMLASGPFSMSFGDTQEVVISLMGAMGKDNRDGVGLVKSIDNVVQDVVNGDFQLPAPLPVPSLHVVELDQHFILDWESDTAQVRNVESYSSKGYKFETYTIYQLPSPTATESQRAPFPPFDPYLPRSMYLSNDILRQRPLIDGQKYYYAVTATYYNPDPSIANQRLESGMVIKTATPHTPNAGIVYPVPIGDLATNSSNVRSLIHYNDALVNITYFDPTRPDGHQYKILYHRNPDQIIDIDEKPTWDFIDISEFKTATAVGGDGTGQIILHSLDRTGWKKDTSSSQNPLYGVSFANIYVGTAVGSNGTILRTSDGGQTWNAQAGGTNGSLYGVYALDTNQATAVGANATVLQTTNGGVTWTSVSTPATDTLRSTSFLDASHGIAVGDNGTIIHTGGNNHWFRDSSHTTTGLKSVAFSEVNSIIAVGGQGTVLRTTDGGFHWLQSATGTTADLNGVAMTDPNTGTVVGANGTILRTTDRGVSWTSQVSGVTNDLFGVSFADSLDGVVVGALGTSLHTTDAGATWVSLQSNVVTDLYATSATNDLPLLSGVQIDAPPQRILLRGMFVETTSPIYGFKGVFETRYGSVPTRNEIFNTPNPEGTIMVVAQGSSDIDTITGGNPSDVDIELRFNGDSSWALMVRDIEPQSKWVRVPYTAWAVGVVGKDSINHQLYTTITEEGADSIWRPLVLLDRSYNGKTLKEFYPITVINDSIRLGNSFFGSKYYDDVPFRQDSGLFKTYLWLSSIDRQNSVKTAIWKAYIVDLNDDGIAAPVGTTIRFERFKYVINRDVKIYTASKVQTNNLAAEKSEVDKINVYPNPYYAFNRAEVNKFQHFITFNHLPHSATIRIFNLAGILVKTIQKNDDTQFITWDLNNELGLGAAAGIYIAHIELHDAKGYDLGTKILKLMIVPAAETSN